MQQTPGTLALGCGGTLILLGSFIGGFYMGHSQKTGNPIDSNFANVLKFGPTILGALYSPIASNVQMNVPGNLEELTRYFPSDMDSEKAKGCTRSCGLICSTVMGAGMMAGVTYLGYAIGHAMG